MQQAAEYRRIKGIRDKSGARHLVDAYVSLRPGDLSQIALASYIMGAVGIGLNLPSYAMDQFDKGKPWTVARGQHPFIGGHYVPLVGRNSIGNYLVCTWGRLHAVTPGFLSNFMDEGICYLSFESLGKSTRMTPEGFDENGLRKMLAALTRT